MRVHSLRSVAFALALLGLVVPTGAVLTDAGAVDDVWEENGIVVKPAPGPNGAYADVGETGELSIDVSDPGVNKDGRTLIRRVFVVANTGGPRTRLWLTHNATQSVTFFESVPGGVLDRRVIERRSLHGVANARTLAPGERLVVSVVVDTTGRNASADPVLLRTLRLHARTNETTTTTTTSATTTTTTATTTPTTTRVPDGNETVVVDFASTENASYTTDPVNLTALDDEINASTPPVTAVIANASGPGVRASGSRDPLRGNESVDTVVTEGAAVTLTGARSYLARSDRVDRERRVAVARRITVPPSLRDRPAMVRFRVSKAAFPDTAPGDARIGRRTERGWQLLDTRVVRETEDSVVLAARTPGFSVFAVFRAPDVTYTWTLPDGSTHAGPDVRTQFATPGYYNVTLTVRDATGATDTARHRILVNDKPRVRIEQSAARSSGDRVLLHANVTNRFGNHTVRWLLPDGTRETGVNVTYAAPPGAHDVRVTVTDEYGATGTATRTLGGPATRLERLRTLAGDRFLLLTWLALLGLTAVAVALLVRRPALPGRVGLARAAVAWALSRGRGPRVSLAAATWNPVAGRLRLRSVAVTDSHELADLAIVVRRADGTVLARKTVDLDRRTRYDVRAEDVPGIPVTALRPGDESVVAVRATNRHGTTTTTTRPVTWHHPGGRGGVPGPGSGDAGRSVSD